jgi:hypothetical protein
VQIIKKPFLKIYICPKNVRKILSSFTKLYMILEYVITLELLDILIIESMVYVITFQQYR